MTVRKSKATNARVLQQALEPAPAPSIVNPPKPKSKTKDRKPGRQREGAVPRGFRVLEQARRQAESCAELQSLPVQHQHAAGIDAGDASHWVCVESTPDGSEHIEGVDCLIRRIARLQGLQSDTLDEIVTLVDERLQQNRTAANRN